MPPKKKSAKAKAAKAAKKAEAGPTSNAMFPDGAPFDVDTATLSEVIAAADKMSMAKQSPESQAMHNSDEMRTHITAMYGKEFIAEQRPADEWYCEAVLRMPASSSLKNPTSIKDGDFRQALRCTSAAMGMNDAHGSVFPHLRFKDVPRANAIELIDLLSQAVLDRYGKGESLKWLEYGTRGIGLDCEEQPKAKLGGGVVDLRTLPDCDIGAALRSGAGRATWNVKECILSSLAKALFPEAQEQAGSANNKDIKNAPGASQITSWSRDLLIVLAVPDDTVSMLMIVKDVSNMHGTTITHVEYSMCSKEEAETTSTLAAATFKAMFGLFRKGETQERAGEAPIVVNLSAMDLIKFEHELRTNAVSLSHASAMHGVAHAVDIPAEQRAALSTVRVSYFSEDASGICQCLKPATSACAKCNVASYCCRECQVSDWKRHKAVCGALKATVPATEKAATSAGYRVSGFA